VAPSRRKEASASV